MAISRTGWGERFVFYLPGFHAPRGKAVVAGLSAVVALLAASPGLGQSVLYVDTNATGPVHDGSSWCNAYTALQDALANARVSNDLVTEVRVADGTYRPDQGANQVPSDREASFQLINGVAVRGGFAGCDAPDPDERDVTIHETILSGDLSGDDGPHFANNEENSYHVFFHPEELDLDDMAALEGFTITGGNANGSDAHYRGGGMYNAHSSPTMSNCTFSRNSGDYGGGMYNKYPASPVVIDCMFSGNSAEHGGGGMYNFDGSTPTVMNCTFNGNLASAGGGMYNSFSSPTVTNCTFSGNWAVGFGGGGMCSYSSSPTVTNCQFSGNWASAVGGMYNLAFSSLTMTNCTFSGNSASYYAGAIGNYRSSAAVTNCILWGNTPGEIYASVSSSLDVTYSCILNGYVGEGNVDANPLFVDPGYWDDNGMPEDPDDDFWPDGDYHLQASSPCIDAGDNAALPLSVLTDLDGNARFVDDPLAPDVGSGTPPIVDMGAYERQLVLVVPLDILPRRCPNRISIESRRPVPVAIVGADTFDVMQIDPDSLVLRRADGVGGSVRLVAGKPGRGITIKDVATPFDGDLCGCHKRHGDGIDDLVAVFSMGDMAEVLQLNSARRGEQVMLTVSGLLLDGNPFEASDCILIMGRP